MLASIRIYFLANRVQSHCAKVLHLLNNICVKVDLAATFLYLSFEICKRKLISVLVASVLRTLYLDCIVGQVHKVIVQILCIH